MSGEEFWSPESLQTLSLIELEEERKKVVVVTDKGNFRARDLERERDQERYVDKSRKIVRTGYGSESF
ncbi:hypothetical protein PROFUN_11441 [Planoprotostelium fungivorum]|uniref:Uncharacterized protein n=1 Tax=Planoprotostelium fungivorum TaxID=1890364 RepID=A0A2P6N4V1_9EUKA|nr:hypothetical protein PROFUN_11441 [Planoprotostelium fungivorum]